MTDKIAFRMPVKIDRPYGTHRFDVYSTKINRPITIYRKRQLEAWVVLEYDVDVMDFCERPLVIDRETERAPRSVDFWIKRSTESAFWLLLRPAEQRCLDEGRHPYPAFEQWAIDQGVRLELLNDHALQVPGYLMQNYRTALHYIESNSELVPNALLDAVPAACATSRSLSAIERELAPADKVLVRTAIFMCVVRGILSTDSFLDRPLGPHTLFWRRS